MCHPVHRPNPSASNTIAAIPNRFMARHTRADQTAAHQKSDRRSDDLYEGGLHRGVADSSSRPFISLCRCGAESKSGRIRRVKHRQIALAIFASLSASIALADDFKTIEGKEYKNAIVSRIEPDGIVLKTKSGITKVYFTELPKKIQDRFHYNAQQAAQFTSQTTAQTGEENRLIQQQQQAEEAQKKAAQLEMQRRQQEAEMKRQEPQAEIQRRERRSRAATPIKNPAELLKSAPLCV